jgi:hypothetical protein
MCIYLPESLLSSSFEGFVDECREIAKRLRFRFFARSGVPGVARGAALWPITTSTSTLARLEQEHQHCTRNPKEKQTLRNVIERITYISKLEIPVEAVLVEAFVNKNIGL